MTEEILTLEIEKLIYGGRSLAKQGSYPFFIEGGCPGDIVKARIIKRNKSYGLAAILEIEKPSDKRIKPFCPMHNICGGCGLQHIKYEEQLIQKQNIVKETIYKIYGKDIAILPVKSPLKNTEYRYKVQYPVSQTKVSKRIIAGYFKKGTHEAVNIKYCPVQPKIIDEITDFIRKKSEELKISGYNEKKHKGLLRHIIFRMSKPNNKILITLVLNANNISENIKILASRLMELNSQITGVLANFNTAKTNVITSDKTEIIIGKDFIEEKIGNIIYKISSMSFFQVNPEAAKILFDTAKDLILQNTDNPVILDAYSGVSAFGLQLKDIARKIICVEENKSSTDDAKYNVKINNAHNITVINDDAAKTFSKFVREKKFFDIVLLDPPRKGCSKDSLDFAAKLSKKFIIYISCNPSSLASDLKYLDEKGFKPKIIQPVDMFCHTPHIENVVLIEKD